MSRDSRPAELLSNNKSIPMIFVDGNTIVGTLKFILLQYITLRRMSTILNTMPH